LWLSEGDAPTKFFHVQANARRCRKHIRSLQYEGQTLFDENCKAPAAYEFFEDVLGTSPPRTNTINLDMLDLCHIDHAGLGNRFTEAGVWDTIHALPLDKTPRSDGFMARFLQVAWLIIRVDLMVPLMHFGTWIPEASFHSINEALMVLLSKSTSVTSIKHY
jgi:hypothetical protein